MSSTCNLSQPPKHDASHRTSRLVAPNPAFSNAWGRQRDSLPSSATSSGMVSSLSSLSSLSSTQVLKPALSSHRSGSISAISPPVVSSRSPWSLSFRKLFKPVDANEANVLWAADCLVGKAKISRAARSHLQDALRSLPQADRSNLVWYTQQAQLTNTANQITLLNLLAPLSELSRNNLLALCADLGLAAQTSDKSRLGLVGALLQVSEHDRKSVVAYARKDVKLAPQNSAFMVAYWAVISVDLRPATQAQIAATQFHLAASVRGSF